MKNTPAYLLWLFFFICVQTYAQNDCPEALYVCGNSDYYGLDATGIGSILEINSDNACASGENNTLWLKVVIKDGGTLGFDIIPENIDDLGVDFDFWLFGPDVSCGDLGTAIRCSTTNPNQAELDYNTTGMNATATDVSEGPGPDGNSYVNWITVQDDEVYYLIVDRPHGASNFSLIWSGTATFHEVPQFLNPDNIPLVIEQCDNDDVNDFSTAFDLTVYEEMFIGPQTDVAITYHNSNNDMITGENPIDNPAAYHNTSDPQTIYMRITNPITNCYSTETLAIQLTPQIQAGEPQNFTECDTNQDGFFSFNLELNNDLIKNGNTECAVSYYASEQEAITATTAPLPLMYQNQVAYTPETIWARLEKTNGCLGYDIKSFTINVNPVPQFNNPQNIDLDLYKCDEDNVDDLSTVFDLTAHEAMFTGNQQNIIYTYHTTADAAVLGTPFIDNPSGFANTSNPQQLFIRAVNMVTGCSAYTQIQLHVLPTPVAPLLQPLQECDFNNDGFAVFNLQAVLSQLAQDINDVTVTIHETAEDAVHNANTITNTIAYSNIVANGQVLYIRVSANYNECFSVTELQLIVNPVPEAVTPADYALCDNGQDDTDGQAIFDLGTVAEEVLGGLDTSLYSVSYYDDETNAENGISPITTPGAYLSPTATVYIRVTENATGCYDVVALELIVNPLPVVSNPVPYSLCDEDNPGDEQEVFDLTTKIDEITGGADGVTVTFHDTYQEAEGNTNAIATPEAYTNTTTVETLFVRVTDNETGCYRIVLLDVRVEPLPVIVPPTQEDLTTCDTNGMGIGVFDLEALIEDMVNNGENLLLQFYDTHEDAENDVNPISNIQNFQNVDPYLQFIYVRVTDTITGCFRTYQLTLIVEPAPQAPDVDDLTQCDDTDNNGQDGQAYFDLTVQEESIYEALGLEAGSLTIHYFTSEENADAGAPRITTPQHYYGSDGQMIWIRVEDPDTECYSLTSFTLHLNAPVAVVTPTPLVLCNEALPNDGQTEFNLTVKDEEILGVWGVGQGDTVTYYESLADRDNDNPIATPEAYTNPAPPQGNPKTLQVVVTTPEGCKSYTTLTIKVLPLPVPDTTPDALVQCDDNGNGDGVEPFDLTEAEDDIRNNDNSVIITYYTSEEDAATGDNPIPDPANHVSGTATVWVRVAANTGNPNDPVCYQVVALELVVNPLPALGDEGVIEPYAICEPDTDGFATFDLTAHYDEILIGEDPSEYTITFSYNSMPVPYTYTNVVANSQTIDVKVVNNETGCEATAPLTLLVEPQAIANPIVDGQLQQTCDTDGENDGYYSPGFDLTVVAPEVLGSQDAAIHQVTYYESFEDAQAGTNAIADPTAYVNSTPYGMTIWVRIINTTTVSGCADFTSFELLVEPLPEPQLTGGTLCIDYNTGEVYRPVLLDSGLENNYTFNWYHDGVVIVNANGPAYTATEPGEYTVTATSPNGCVSVPIAPVTVNLGGPASPIASGYIVGNELSDTKTLTVLVEGYGQYQYSLSPEGPWQNSNVFTDVPLTIQNIYIRDTAGDCDAVILTNIQVIDYPPYFSPNEDGFEDYWNINGLNGHPEARIYIFDRYGKLLKQLASNSKGWDGSYNGHKLPASDYWFTLEFGSGQNMKGHFSLIR
ncbi:T9SS type B sorting domain-containing protein [Flavobacterium rhizosphaerae]|uniref:T9SS type B sorting domain-containing protein n=1 Tax=Flavobacterium rhizosphaerae TaxID=3163298 RepID=A0ABW8YVH3_9FLAO